MGDGGGGKKGDGVEVGVVGEGVKLLLCVFSLTLPYFFFCRHCRRHIDINILPSFLMAWVH